MLFLIRFPNGRKIQNSPKMRVLRGAGTRI